MSEIVGLLDLLALYLGVNLVYLSIIDQSSLDLKSTLCLLDAFDIFSSNILRSNSSLIQLISVVQIRLISVLMG